MPLVVVQAIAADDSSRRPLAGSLAGAGRVPPVVTAWVMPGTGSSVAAESAMTLSAQPSAQLPHVCGRQHSILLGFQHSSGRNFIK